MSPLDSYFLYERFLSFFDLTTSDTTDLVTILSSHKISLESVITHSLLAKPHLTSEA